jgi:membrane peptidoglycan carboxypeptidase
MRLRVAMANDYQAPAAQVLSQMGIENVDRIAGSFGVSPAEPLSLVDAAGVYGVFAQQGVYFGQDVNGSFQPAAVLRVEGNDGSVWLDWTTPQAKPVVTPGLAYLVNHALSDESARWPSLGQPNVAEIDRPSALKLGQTEAALDTWSIGYSPSRVVAVWMGARESSPLKGEQRGVSTRIPATLWSALMQIASQDLPPEGWPVPADVSGDQRL